MTDTNDTNTEQDQKTAFDLDAINLLDQRLIQLKSMLLVAYSDEFNDFSHEIRTGYLWGCYDLAEQAQQAAENIRK